MLGTYNGYGALENQLEHYMENAMETEWFAGIGAPEIRGPFGGSYNKQYGVLGFTSPPPLLPFWNYFTEMVAPVIAMDLHVGGGGPFRTFLDA